MMASRPIYDCVETQKHVYIYQCIMQPNSFTSKSLIPLAPLKLVALLGPFLILI